MINIETGMGLLGISFMIVMMFAVVGIFIFLFIFWILMIIDVAKRDFKEDSEKVVWILVLVFLGWLGAIIYYFVVKGDDKKKGK